jgi:hypothetical protein
MANPQSLEAWASGNKEATRWKVYRHVCGCCRQGGATLDETSQKLGVMPNQISGRFGELVDAGLIIPLLDADGKQVRRQTRTGCWAGVYVASPSREASEPELLFPDPVCPWRDPEEG